MGIIKKRERKNKARLCEIFCVPSKKDAFN